MLSPKLVTFLADHPDPDENSWADRVLKTTLRKLQVGGPTEWEHVVVLDAWTGPGDRVNFVYQPPWMNDTLGLSLGVDSPWVTLAYEPHGDGVDQYAWSIADFNIAEPIGMTYDLLERDSNGIGWWGDLPFPGIASPANPETWNRGWR